jgi:hypothetical protein
MAQQLHDASNVDLIEGAAKVSHIAFCADERGVQSRRKKA